MSTTVALLAVEERRGGARIVGAARDSFAVAVRNLIAYRRVPQLLVFSTIQPVIFVLMFRYVFGGAIKLPGSVSYVDYLMPGIFVQTLVFGSLAAAIGLAADQPVSVTVSAVRDLVLGTPVASDLLQALAWMAGIVLVFAPLAVRRYRRAV